MGTRVRKAAIWLAAAPWLAGCGLYGPCDHQRGIVLYATTTGADVREVGQSEPRSMVAIWEHQRDGFRREVIWTVLAPRLRGTVTQVHLHEGLAASGGGPLLYSFPIQNAQRDVHPDSAGRVIDQVTAGSVEGYGDGTPGAWYQGTVPIQDLMQRMYGGNTYLEVHTDSVPGGEFRAGQGTPSFLAQPEDPATWQAIYCS
jgi:hypothetical protein